MQLLDLGDGGKSATSQIIEIRNADAAMMISSGSVI